MFGIKLGDTENVQFGNFKGSKFIVITIFTTDSLGITMFLHQVSNQGAALQSLVTLAFSVFNLFINGASMETFRTGRAIINRTGAIVRTTNRAGTSRARDKVGTGAGTIIKGAIINRTRTIDVRTNRTGAIVRTTNRARTIDIRTNRTTTSRTTTNRTGAIVRATSTAGTSRTTTNRALSNRTGTSRAKHHVGTIVLVRTGAVSIDNSITILTTFMRGTGTLMMSCTRMNIL
jgi:hypothetical protein